MQAAKWIGLLLTYVVLFIGAFWAGDKFGDQVKPALPRESMVVLLMDYYQRHGSLSWLDSPEVNLSWYDTFWPISWDARFVDSMRYEAGRWRFQMDLATSPNEVRLLLWQGRPDQESHVVLHLRDGVVLPLNDEAKGGDALQMQ